MSYKYTEDDILECGISCEDGTQFLISQAACGDYIAEKIVIFPDEKPANYRNKDFGMLMTQIIRDHGAYECMEIEY